MKKKVDQVEKQIRIETFIIDNNTFLFQIYLYLPTFEMILNL